VLGDDDGFDAARVEGVLVLLEDLVGQDVGFHGEGGGVVHVGFHLVFG